MSKVHVIAMDTHSQTSDVCVKTRANVPGKRYRVKTTIPELVAVIEQVPRPRELVLEEGPLADWLLRNLRAHVDKAQACDPRKNALIAKDGDKDDPIDAGKLADLYLGGYTKAVYHSGSLARQVAKQAVGLYHDRVAHRVAQGNKVSGLFKCWGVMVKEKDFQKPAQREALLAALGDAPEARAAAGHVRLLWRSYDAAAAEEAAMHQELVKLAKQQEVVVRWQQVPGIGWIRAMTLYAYVDTPWRFKGKRKLWKYLGIGLVREHSGSGRTRVHVHRGASRVLKNVIIGAAETVIMHKKGVLYRRYEQWCQAGLSYKNARRNVARDIATAMWAMWKSGADFDEQWLGGKPAEALTEGGRL